MLAPFSSQCKDAVSYFGIKIDNIENYKEECLRNVRSNDIEVDDDIFLGSENHDYPTKEEIFLQQSKRSIYYRKSKLFFKKCQQTWLNKFVMNLIVTILTRSSLEIMKIFSG